MRKNYPITQRNHQFPKHQTLISITDTKGRITYCNDDFITVSGYSKEELLGQPHNLLRHPDMPSEAFRDFWESIQDGRLWSAIIKNRRKNGDHYWVRANATPMRNGDQIVGYLSVRTAPSDEEVRNAERLYDTMNREAESGRIRHRLRGGVVQKTGFIASLLRRLKPRNTSVKHLIPLARRLASGDLSQLVDISKIPGDRRLLLPIVQLGLSTRTVMADVRTDLQHLQEAAYGIAASSENLSQHTQAQSDQLNLTANTMDEQARTAVHNIQVFRLSASDRTHAELNAVQLRTEAKQLVHHT